jgi:hypothetical protein
MEDAMRKSRIAAIAGLAMMLACGGYVCGAAATDSVNVTTGGTVVIFGQNNENHEYFQALQSAVTPANFTDATVWLTGPADHGEAPLWGLYSDGFTINSVNGHLNIYFISAGATADEQNTFVIDTNQFTLGETGGFQDVSSYFGQSSGFAEIRSDIPEPATWALMMIGLGVLGAGLRGSRRGLTVAV